MSIPWAASKGSPAAERNRRLTLPAAVLVTCGLLLAAVTVSAGDLTGATLDQLILLSGLVLVTLTIALRANGWRDPLDPVIFYPLLLWTVFGLIQLMPEGTAAQGSSTLFAIAPDQLLLTFVQVLMGIACFLIGYLCFGRPTTEFVLSSEELSKLRPSRILPVVMLVTLAKVGLLALGNFGYVFSTTDYSSTLSTTGPLSLIVSLTPYALILSAAAAFRPGAARSDRWFFIVVFALEMAFALISGTKISLLLPAVSAGIGFLYVKGRFPWRAFAVGLLVFLFLVPAIERYRDLLNSPGVRVGTPAAALGYAGTVAREVWEKPQVGERLGDGSLLLLGRINELRAFAVIRDKTPRVIPYESGELYVIAPLISVVPRALWPSKPILNVGERTSRDYYNIPRGTSTTRTIMGDLHANFGPPGVAVGMMFLGLVVGALRRYFVIKRTALSLLIYSAGIFLMLEYESDFASLLASLPRTIVLVGLLGFWVTYDRRRETPILSRGNTDV